MRQIILATVGIILFSACNKTKDKQTDPPIPNNKAVTWNKTFGGSNYDFAKSVVQLPSGDYVMAGTTRSTDGDVTGGRVGYDAWMVKTDTAGNKIWSFTYGTNADEHVSNLIATADGGFLLVGHVGFNFDTTINSGWIIKTNSTGNQQWRKDYITSTDSKIIDVVNANGGGYIAVGYTTGSPNGRDGWITKIDANGNPVWNKTLGGTKEDQITSIIKASDGGYIVAGSSASSDVNLTTNRGGFDAWITNIDETGNSQWSKTFGGSNKDYITGIVAANDGGYVAVGSTKSADGDVLLNRGSFDELVIKIDRNGNKQWVKTFGGTNDEYVTSVAAGDGGFLTVGYTNSTNYDVNRTAGDFGGWLIKMDGNGSKTASSTYGDNYDDLMDKIISTQDGGYIIAGQNFNPSSLYNAWLVKIKGL
jgi:hypothetical protein